MKGIDKIAVFEHELAWIKNEKIKQFAKHALEILPDYFFEVAASSTGKYHPDYALGEGGLLRHTKAAVAIAKDLLNLEMYGKYTNDEKDLMLVAIILHDGQKHGINFSKYTVATHPIDCAFWLEEKSEWEKYLTEEQFRKLFGAISSHMGEWSYDYKSKKEILPKPKTAMEKFVHQADYLASRKYLEVDFKKINYTEVRI